MSKQGDSLSVNESTGITIPLRNLLAIIFGVAVAVVGYFEIDERIMMLEHKLNQAQQYIETNTLWIDEWESDGILPLDVEQNMRLDHIEWRINKVGL